MIDLAQCEPRSEVWRIKFRCPLEQCNGQLAITGSQVDRCQHLGGVGLLGLDSQRAFENSAGRRDIPALQEYLTRYRQALRGSRLLVPDRGDGLKGRFGLALGEIVAGPGYLFPVVARSLMR